jgi:conjugative transfer signal peptidase TraF
MVVRLVRRHRFFWWLGSPVALVGTGWLVGLRLNVTGSLPVGLYLASRAVPLRGAIVLACLPPSVASFARERGYVPPGGYCPSHVLPVGKPVLALAGDTVTVTTAGLLLNGMSVPNSRPLRTDRKGRLLPRLAIGRYVVRPGSLWIVSSYSRFSFDSRYFGPVNTGQVRTCLRPLWTIGAGR